MYANSRSVILLALLGALHFPTAVGFTCTCGDVIGDSYENDGYCDCSACEDETAWTCATCAVGCPSCGSPIAQSSCGSSSGGDPFTHFGNRSVQYWPPFETRTTLLEVGGMKLDGVVQDRRPDTDNRWFGKFILSSDDVDIVRARVVPGQALLSQEEEEEEEDDEAGGVIDTLLVEAKLEGGWQSVTSQSNHLILDGQAALDFETRKGKFGKGRKQALVIKSPHMSVTIESAKAQKFPDEFRQLKYVHLDMKVDGLSKEKAITGVLPQIWGLVPMTPTVEAMLKKPESEAAPNVLV